MRRWARARNGLRAGLGSAAAILAAALAGDAVGISLPAEVWLGIPALALVGWGWPLPWERFLLRAGRRIGVGERLAAADVLVRHGAPALLGPLLAEIAALRPRMWRILVGPLELGACALALCLALAVGLIPVRRPSPAVAVSPPPEATVTETVAPPAPTPDPPDPPDAVPGFPAHADAPAYSPYQDLLAAVLGLDGDLAGGLLGEALTARLAQEEGLLRQLAEWIAAAAPGGLSPSERADLVPMAQEVARADLRERLQRLLDREDEAAAREAATAVTAVIEAAERVEGDGDPGAGGPPGADAGATAQRPAPGEGAGGEIPELNGINGLNGHDGLDAGGRSDIAGTAAGDPLDPGPAGEWDSAQDAAAPTAVGAGDAGEGPIRAYIVPGIPGEPPPTPSATPTALTPHEVDIILRARGVPAELRDLVRRYFELVAGGGA